jgi:hypothetical protein
MAWNLLRWLKNKPKNSASIEKNKIPAVPEILITSDNVVERTVFGAGDNIVERTVFGNTDIFVYGAGDNVVNNDTSGITMHTIDGSYTVIDSKELALDWFAVSDGSGDWSAYVPNEDGIVSVRRNTGGGWDAFYNYAVIGNSPTREEAMISAETVGIA